MEELANYLFNSDGNGNSDDSESRSHKLVELFRKSPDDLDKVVYFWNMSNNNIDERTVVENVTHIINDYLEKFRDTSRNYCDYFPDSIFLLMALIHYPYHNDLITTIKQRLSSGLIYYLSWSGQNPDILKRFQYPSHRLVICLNLLSPEYRIAYASMFEWERPFNFYCQSSDDLFPLDMLLNSVLKGYRLVDFAFIHRFDNKLLAKFLETAVTTATATPPSTPSTPSLVAIPSVGETLECPICIETTQCYSFCYGCCYKICLKCLQSSYDHNKFTCSFCRRYHQYDLNQCLELLGV